MRPFQFVQPKSSREAIALLSEHGARACLMAGGTDLLVEIKEGVRAPDVIIDAKKVDGMNGLSFSGTAGLDLGALVTVREVETSGPVRDDYRSLWQAAREVGSIQVRNRATVVGNVCRASPSADMIPPLIADGATVHILGADGLRTVALEAFFTGPGKTVLGPHEIVERITIPAPAAGTGKCYIKHGRRKAMELATVGIAVTLTMSHGTCASVRIALGAVAPRPIRALGAEAVLLGNEPDDELVASCGAIAAAETSPISNVRGSADYRRKMVEELTQRAIRSAMEAAR